MVGLFENEDFGLMEFYQKDLVFWIRFKEKHEEEEELREIARDFIIYNEWSIKKIKEMIDEGRTKFRKTG